MCHSEQVLANKIRWNLLNIALIKISFFDQSSSTSLKLLQACKTEWKSFFPFSFPATKINIAASIQATQLQEQRKISFKQRSMFTNLCS